MVLIGNPSDCAQLTNTVTSTAVNKGLSPAMALGAMIIGHALVCIPAMLDGYVSMLLSLRYYSGFSPYPKAI